VALAIAVFANLRCESRGGHFRSDFPDPASRSQANLMTLAEILAHASSVSQEAFLRTA